MKDGIGKKMEINKDSVEIISTDDDGYIIIYHYKEENENGKELWRDEVRTVEYGESDKETLQRMFYSVAELFGYHYDKFSRENLNITFDKVGHKCSTEESSDA